MGGGAPSVAGGMTEMQYRQLQMEERAFMAQQEERQMQLMNEMEEKRLEREQAEMQKQERLRTAEEEALGRLEEGITEEVTGLKTSEEDEDKDIVMDFYGSLAKGSDSTKGRPE